MWCEIPRSVEWTVYDSERDKLKTVKAESQKKAWKKAARYGAVARRTDHCRPRNAQRNIMKKEEFEEWLEKQL